MGLFEPKHITLERLPGLYLVSLPNKGRGVFCQQDIAEGTVIETTPALLVDVEEMNVLRQTILGNYFFRPADMSEDLRHRLGLGERDKLGALSLGVVSICNHARAPNTEYDILEDHHSIYFQLTAAQDIPKGEEILISYGDIWFALRRFFEGEV